MSTKPPYGCRDYRQEMILVGLHRRLSQENLSEEERRALEEEIRQIEAERFR
ncbi:MAG: hypothetical protein QNJ48_04215 [Desulfobacterales bacterium]|nr:hypothetical protein [Desulfobacterales bacterium]MDJ0883336.1 hypothetical protein [Desulfobacterales bacterium]